MQVELPTFQGVGSGVDAAPLTETGRRAGRRDGRAQNEMRALSVTTGALPGSDGSARVRLGGTDIVVGIHGPTDGPPPRQDPDALHVMVSYRRRDAAPTPDAVAAAESVCARDVRALVSDVILAALHPRKSLVVAVQVLCDRGAVAVAAVNATALALMDAGIPMRIMPTAASVAVANGALVVDPVAVEEREADAVVTCVFDASQSKEHGFISVITEGDVGGDSLFAAAVETTRQLAVKTRAFISLSLQQKARRRFVWTP